jgi:hypothetical protein
MTAATDGGSSTIDMGGNFLASRWIQAVMMPQAPAVSGLPALWHGQSRAGARLTQAFVMPQCSYTPMTNRLRFGGCDPFRVACQ